jgi:hypothetical protein
VIHGRGVGRAVDLGAVAGGEDGGFHGAVSPARVGQGCAQALQRRRDLIERERKTAPHIERRRVVIDT